MQFLKSAALAAIAIVAVAACGPAAATPAGQPAGATPVPATTGAAATPAGATGAPASPAPTAGGAAGGLPSDLCSLLTAAEVSTVVGKTYEAGVPDGYGSCSWNVGKTSANSGDLIFAGSQAADLDLIKNSFPGGADGLVSGHAVYWNPKQGLGTLWVDVGGGKLLTIGLPRSKDLDDTEREVAEKLAELALAKM